MRAKTLVLTAALGLVGAATSMAQVYSVNAVGYVNITIPVGPAGGYSLIANPLNGTNNHWNTVLSLPADQIGTTAYTWDNGTGYTADPPTWGGDPAAGGAGWVNANGPLAADVYLNPGQGIMINPVSGSGATSVSITFVGEVPQGSLSNTNLYGNGKKSYVSSQVPQRAGLGRPGLANSLELPTESGDLVYYWSLATGFSEAWTSLGAAGWLDPLGNITDEGPIIEVGFGFVLDQVSGTATAWNRTFNVN